MLTETESRLIARVDALERRWRLRRLFILAYGLLAIVGAFYMRIEFTRDLVEVTGNMSGTESPTGLQVFFASTYAYLLSLAHLVFLSGFFCIMWALLCWRGNPTNQLVLLLASRVGRDTEEKPTVA